MTNKTKLIIAALILGIYMFSLISLASALVINDVAITPDTIAPGENAQVTLSIKNNGENDLTDVSVSLDFTNVPLAPYNSGSDYTISELNSDKTKDAQFEIVAFNDAKSGIYKIPVRIDYNEDDVIKTKTSLISIMINSVPIIEADVEDGLLLKGVNNKMTIKIVNKGLADVKFLEIEAGSSTSYSILSQKKIYVGDVDSNDFQTVDFNVYFDSNGISTVNFPVTVYYKDVANKEYTEDFNIPLKVYSREQAQKLGLVSTSNYGLIITIVVIVIIIFIIYRIIRKRRRKAAEEQ